MEDKAIDPTQTPQDTQAPQQASDPTKINLTPEQLTGIRNGLTTNLVNAYGEFVKKISGIPAQRTAAIESFKFFDTGFLWLKEAIQNLQTSDINLLPVQAPSSPQQETQTQPTEAQATAATPESTETAPINEVA